MKKTTIIYTVFTVLIVILAAVTSVLLMQRSALTAELTQVKTDLEDCQADIEELKKQIETQKGTILQFEEEADKNDPFNLAIDNLDTLYFVTDPENYAPAVNDVNISEEQAIQIAQKGFEESKSRISAEGADDIDSQTVVLTEHITNNYFTRRSGEPNQNYPILRPCYEITRTNSMKCGVTVYVDAATGLIIGGDAFGD